MYRRRLCIALMLLFELYICFSLFFAIMRMGIEVCGPVALWSFPFLLWDLASMSWGGFPRCAVVRGLVWFFRERDVCQIDSGLVEVMVLVYTLLLGFSVLPVH